MSDKAQQANSIYLPVSARCFPIWNPSTKISILIPNYRCKRTGQPALQRTVFARPAMK